MNYIKTFLTIVSSAVLIASISPHTQAKSVSVSCKDRNFVEIFGNVKTPVAISVTGPIKTCKLKPTSASGWVKGKGCKFVFSKSGSLSGAHRGVFGGKLNCGGGNGNSQGSEVTWRGTAALCPGGLSEVERVREGRQVRNELDCPRDQRVKSPDVGPPGSVTPIDGCSFPGIANLLAVFWESRNVIASAPDAGRLLAGGQGPNSGLPCDEHDVCYRKCGADKGSCDKQIVAGIVSQCNNYDEGWEEIAEQRTEEQRFQVTPEELRQQCVSSASVVGDGVRSGFGQRAYTSRQIERCSCCEK